MPFEKPKDSSQEQPQKDPEFISERFPSPEEYLQNLEKMGLQEYAEAYRKVLEVAEIIKNKGGRAFLIGGSVRDFVMGKTPKDFDLEVYGLKPDDLEKLIKPIGKVSDVGKAFGILKIMLGNGLDIDVSLPRTDSKIGVGHKGFKVKADPFMSNEDAARRRDFTMNSMATDPLTGKILDPFGGVKDIKNKLLRITDEERFKDDPLRVLRALQFAGRFGMEIEQKSMNVIKEIVDQLKELPKERIGEEWKKLLLRSEKPSVGLSYGMDLGVLDEIHPEFPPLAKTDQDPVWHPEGNVWIHTLKSVDEVSEIVRKEKLDEKTAFTILLATLCHDLGKPTTTELVDGRIKSHRHDQEGKDPTESFLKAIGTDRLTGKKVVKLVTNHITPITLFLNETERKIKVSNGVIRRLAMRIHPATIEELVYVCEADFLGRDLIDSETKKELRQNGNQFPAGKWLLEKARSLNVEKKRPENLTRGKNWLKFGFKQSSGIGKLIKLSNDLRDEKNYSKEMIFEAVAGIDKIEKAIEKLENCLHNNSKQV